jgi:hypothetical protein
LNNSAIFQSKKTAKPKDLQPYADKNTSSCLMIDGNLSVFGEPLSATKASMSPCQDSLLTEYLNVVSSHKRDCLALLSKLSSDTSNLKERRLLDKRSVERDLSRRFDEIEAAVQEASRQVSKRLAAIENTEYEVKYKQAR